MLQRTAFMRNQSIYFISSQHTTWKFC